MRAHSSALTETVYVRARRERQISEAIRRYYRCPDQLLRVGSSEVDEAMDELRLERYASSHRLSAKTRFGPSVRDLYYLLRPLLPVSVRKHMQRIR
jgi:hypothetical protein